MVNCTLYVLSLVSIIYLFTESVELVLLTMSAGSAAFSYYSFARFRRYAFKLDGHARVLTSAISWQILGEAIFLTVSVIFSMAEMTGHMQEWSYALKFWIRFTMFMLTFITTHNLTTKID